jgi:SAM-dependent methyltransferase
MPFHVSEVMQLDWGSEWKLAHERSPLKVTPHNEYLWRAFWNGDAKQYLQEAEAEAPLYRKLVEHLQTEGWLESGDTILDIGCGPGIYSLLLAGHVRSITALDSAKGMLDVLMKECKKRSIRNIEPLCSRWEDEKIEGKYDLVLAALSPAITTASALFSMEKASRSKCCFITSCPSEWMNVRNELWEEVVGEFHPSDAYSVKYPLNILLEAKRRPDLHHFTAKVKTKLPAQEVVDNYVRYFSIFTVMDEKKIGRVRDYIYSRSSGGTFSKEAEKCLYLLKWRKSGATTRSR